MQQEGVVDEYFTAITKVFFHDQPDGKTVRRAYWVEGDVVYVSNIDNGFYYTVYTNANGQTTSGWLKMSGLRANRTINEYAWIVGDWAPNEESYAEGEIITFKENGIFSFGDDCTTKGTYTIKENTVYLKGTTTCSDSDPDFQENYTETLKTKGNTIVGYSKN